MQIFIFKDKKKNIEFQGIVPSDVVNCAPFDFFRYAHAEELYNNL